jgi:hypothetical protein
MYRVYYKYSENEGYREADFDTLEEAQEEALYQLVDIGAIVKVEEL